MLIFVANIRPARTFWNSTHCLLSPFTLDWSRNLWHNPMWNMAVNNISYPISPLSTRTEKGYITKMIPFFFVQYICCFRMVNSRDTQSIIVIIPEMGPIVIQRQMLTMCWEQIWRTNLTTMLTILVFNMTWWATFHKQKQKYRGMFETQKSRNKTSSGDIGLNIRTLASPKVG